MRLLVYHNPSAGHDEVPRDTLMSDLQRAGHEAVWLEKGHGKVRELLRQHLEAVVVVGGDGSVAAVARELVSRPIPIAILPAGTANNLATVLGATPGNLLRALAERRTVPFDVGVVETDGVKRFFLEGVGYGPFADAVAILSRREDGPDQVRDRADELDRDLHVLRECALKEEPCECHLDLDGNELAGTLLMVEILNTGMIGPNLRFAPEGVPFDGLLDVVVVDAAEREELIAYLRERKRNSEARWPFKVRPAQKVRFRVPGGRRIHIDGEPLEHEDPMDLRIAIEPGALRFLVPRDTRT